MSKLVPALLALLSCAVATSCQSAHPLAPAASTQTPATRPAPDAATPAGARATLARYLQQQPNAAVYQLDSATVTDVDTKWQILVPRTDWAKVMPNAAAFEVDKKTGAVTVLRVR